MIDTIYRAIGADEVATVDCKIPKRCKMKLVYLLNISFVMEAECSTLLLVNRHDDDDL